MSIGILPDDKDLPRNRSLRYVVLILSFFLFPALSSVAGVALMAVFTEQLRDNSLLLMLGGTIGAGLGFVGFMAIKHRFFVTNTTTGILLTTDTLKAFFGADAEKVFVSYGPGGPFVAFPWESRTADGNISIKTATNEFTSQIQCRDGLVNAGGSYRLRPDHRDPRRFQTGVAAVADDLKDLIISFLIGEVGDRSIAEVLRSVEVLNEALKAKFVGTVPGVQTEFELEHGVYVVDVTLSSLLPSAEVQRTMSGITEAGFIAEGTRIMLGFSSQRAVNAALKAGRLTRAEYNNARDRFMAVSGNMEGVNVTRYEIDLNASGIEKETAEALTILLRNTPPQVIAGLATQTTQGKST